MPELTMPELTMLELTMLESIRIVQGDITQQVVDAIVNAGNNPLLGGGGVDGAIHRAAGPGLLAECRGLGNCETGEAKITKGYNLPAKWVIHTVGPTWGGGNNHEAELLARCYHSCLVLAGQHDVKTIAFPAISAGAYGFPPEQAARIAVTETQDFLESSSSNLFIDEVTFVCFSAEGYRCYRKRLESALGSA